MIYAGTSDVIPGGSGHDAIWALDNDTFIIGSPYNRGLGGVGNDKLSIIEGVGGNYLNGGSCTEQLWLISGLGYLPAAKQFVIDFKPGEDKVGLQGVGFSGLSFILVGSDTPLKVAGVEVGHFTGISAASLNSQANFAGFW